MTGALSDAWAGKANTVSEVIRRIAAAQPYATALITSDEAPLLYSDLLRRILDIAGRLRRAGVASNARVAIALPPGPIAVVATVAAACAATAVPLDPRLTANEISEILTTLQIAAIILPFGECPARQAAEGLVSSAPTRGAPSSEVFDLMELLPAPSAPSDGTPEQQAPAYILPTSGTTGRQKFVPVSHSNQIALSERIKSYFELTEDDRCLCLGSTFYSLGLSMGILTPLLTGGSIALPTSPTRPDVMEWFVALKPTWCVGGPTIYRALSEHAAAIPDLKGQHSLRFMVSAGMALPKGVREHMEQTLGAPMLEHYGTTETGMVASNCLHPELRKPETVGIPPPGIVAIADPNGDFLASGATGEILVTGPTLMRGYLDDPQPRSERFINGWFRTGDLGALDKDGFLTMQGRLKEVINRAGEKIMPQEIDAVLSRHPAVREAAAFAVPHPRVGEQVAAAVVLREGQTATASELRKWMAADLARFKIPHRMIFLEELPRSRTGKVQRHELQHVANAQTPPAPANPVLNAPSSITEDDLTRLWARILERETPIGLDEDFFDIGGDSILATEMLLELESVVGVPLDIAILYEASTIRQLAGQLDAFAWSEHRPLVAVQKTGSQTPFFFCHGDYIGGGFYSRRLAQMLGPERPFYVLPPPPLTEAKQHTSLELLATHLLPMLLAAQPQGPLLLGGFCNGGMLAFELARQAIAARRQVALIVMIDPPSFNPRPLFRISRHAVDGALRLAGLDLGKRERALETFSYRFANLWCHLERFERAAGSERVAMIFRRFRRLAGVRPPSSHVMRPNGSKSLPCAPASAGSQTFGHQRPANEVLTERWHRLVDKYVPGGVDAPVLMFSAEYNGNAWRCVCRHLDCVELPRDHDACISSNLGLVGNAVYQRFDRIAAAPWASRNGG